MSNYPYELELEFEDKDEDLELEIEMTMGTTNYDNLTNKPEINGTTIQGQLNSGDLNIKAKDIAYENEKFEEIKTVDDALVNLFEKVYYELPYILNFESTPFAGAREIGSSIPSINFNWEVNKAMVKQTLSDCAVSKDDRTAVYPNTLSSNKVFTLKVTDNKDETASSTLSFYFYPRIYYGVSVAPSAFNNEFVLGLSNKILKSSKSGNYGMNVTSGKYGYWCSPVSYGKPRCFIGGFETELVLEDTISLTNDSGYTQDYYIYRTPNAGLGEITLVIS